MAGVEKLSNLTEDDVRFVFQEHGRISLENQALRGEVARLQGIIASITNARAGNVVEAVSSPSEVSSEAVAP